MLHECITVSKEQMGMKECNTLYLNIFVSVERSLKGKKEWAEMEDTVINWDTVDDMEKYINLFH